MQFGGATGLSLTHRWFTAGSLAVLEHHRLRLNGKARVGSELFSLMLIDRLRRRRYDDRELLVERGRAWARRRWGGRELRAKRSSRFLQEPAQTLWVTR
jgi:hypothetical protein